MIIEGAPAGSVGFWSKHLQRTDTNEQVHIRDTRGTLAQDLDGALLEMQAVASGSRSRGNFMYQANINPYAHEHLTPAQWLKAVDTLEKNLGLDDHQRIVIEHVKEGRQHYHVIWNRVDVDTMRVKDMGGNFYSHERTARQLEQEFGLERAPRVHGEREGERVSKRTELWEYNRGQETGQSRKAIKAEVTALWRGCDSGPAFVEALESQGYILTKGDRRDFCIIDRAGDAHSLGRRLDGVTAKEIKARLSGIDRDNLPTVAQGRELHDERRRERGADRSAGDRLAAAPEVGRNKASLPQTDEQERLSDLAKLGAADRADNAALRNNAPLRDAQNRAYWNDYRQRQDAAQQSRTEAWEQSTRKSRNQAEAKSLPAGIEVRDVAAGTTRKLGGFIASLLGAMVSPPTPKRTAFEQLNESAAERVERIKAGHRSDVALAHISEDLKRGSTIAASDVRNLAPGHLQEIMQKGDAGLLAIIKRADEDRQRQQEQGHEGGRGRER